MNLSLIHFIINKAIPIKYSGLSLKIKKINLYMHMILFHQILRTNHVLQQWSVRVCWEMSLY